MKIDMGIGGLEFGYGVTRFPGLVIIGGDSFVKPQSSRYLCNIQ